MLSLLAGLAETTLDDEPRRFHPAAVVAYRARAEQTPPTPDRVARFPALDYERLPGLEDKLSPITHVSPSDPPVLLVHGDEDELIPVTESERMHAALKEAGVATKLVVLDGVAHEAFRRQKGPNDLTIGRDTGADAEMLEWFKKHLH